MSSVGREEDRARGVVPRAFSLLHSAARRYRQPLRVGVFVEAPIVCIGFYLWFVGDKRHWAMQDFRAIRLAAHAVIHGNSPYPSPNVLSVIRATQLVYPPLIAYFFSPFTALPYSVAAALYFAVLTVAIVAAVYALGVRDWRCYGIPFLWWPAVSSFNVGAIGPLLTLLVALCWRYRNRAPIVGLLAAIAITLKLFLWPLWIWLLATRRFRAAAVTAVLTPVAFILPFAPLGWHVLRGYPHLLRVLDSAFGPVSFSSAALFEAAGVSAHVADGLVVAVGILLIAWIIFLSRGMHSDREAMMVTVVAALLLSPIVWIHYYVLLLVPIALAWPRLAPAWFLPLLFWSLPALEGGRDLRRLITAFVLVLLTLGLSLLATEARQGPPLAARLPRPRFVPPMRRSL